MRKAALLATALAFMGSDLALAASAPFAPVGKSAASSLDRGLIPVATVVVKKKKPKVVVKKKVRRDTVVTTPAERRTTVTTSPGATTPRSGTVTTSPAGGAGVSVGVGR
jgi:hypothetical protein